MGILFAHAGYKMCYRSVWDWRDNHVPLCEWEDEDGDGTGEKDGGRIGNADGKDVEDEEKSIEQRRQG